MSLRVFLFRFLFRRFARLCKVRPPIGARCCDIGIADAGIYAWTAKYTHWGARPFQYLSGYKALITTPNFPGYISGHSTFSGSWDKLLGMLVPSLRNISEYIADLSGISRLYGGIHFSDDNTTGLSAGRSIGDSVYKELMTEINNTQAFL